MAIVYWLTRPRMAWARFRYFLWERANPDKPWLCPGTVEFCRTHLSKSMTALEFGSGRSTRWFAGLVGKLISIEHCAEWYEVVKQQLVAAGIENVDYRFVSLNHPETEPERKLYDPTPDYVAVVDQLKDASLGLGIVDGHYRTTCTRHLVPKIAPGGYLLVDDINMWRSPSDLAIPANWHIADDSTNGVKRCIIWQAPNNGDANVGG